MIDWLVAAWQFRRKMGFWPDLLRPRRFSEKVQVAKAGWRSPLIPQLADKVAVKAFIAREFGVDLVTPNLFVGTALPPPDERSWPAPYVIKVNHRSLGNIFVYDPEAVKWPRVERLVRRWLRTRYGNDLGEWAYRDIPPMVLVEPFIGDVDPPPDIKLFTFAGRVEYVQVHVKRGADYFRVTFFDREWRVAPFTLSWPRIEESFPRPASLDRMIEIAEAIGQRFPFVRVDFYEIDGRPRFSEVTFYPSSGYRLFDPDEWDFRLGALWPAGKPADRW